MTSVRLYKVSVLNEKDENKLFILTRKFAVIDFLTLLIKSIQ